MTYKDIDKGLKHLEAQILKREANNEPVNLQIAQDICIDYYIEQGFDTADICDAWWEIEKRIVEHL